MREGGDARAQSPEERSDEGLWALAARRATPPVAEGIGAILRVP